MKSNRLKLLVLGALILPGLARAQQVVWKDAATPTFDILTAVDLLDDGTSGDQAAGDGLFSRDITLPADATDPIPPRIMHYVVIPPGGDLTTAIGAVGGGPMILDLPDGGARVVRIYFGTEADPNEPLTATCTDPATILSCKGFGPIPSVADDWNLQGAFGIAGDLQAHFGGSAWTGASPDTELTLTAGDGSLELLAAVPLTGGFRVASATQALTLGADGWDFSGVINTGTPYPVDTPEWTRARIEVRLQRGMARIETLPGGVFSPLLTEVSFAGAGRFIEFHNPSAARLSLSSIHLGDDPLYAQLGGSPAAATAGDFLVGFPAGAWIAPGAFATFSLVDATTFSNVHGGPPDFLLSTAPPAYTGAVDAAAALDPLGESLFLFTWSPGDDLVRDLDILVWGAPVAGDEAPDKSGVTVGAGTYGPDDMTVNSSPAVQGPTLERIDFGESGEDRDSAANGFTRPGWSNRHDETSEPLDSTWQVAAAATAGAPPPGFSFSVLGTATRSDTGAPLENVLITIAPTGDTTLTDSNGFYRVFLPDGSYTLTTHLYHHVDSAAAWTMAGGHVVLPLPIDYIPDVSISGRVDRADGRPLEGATVLLLDLPDRENTATQVTDFSGTFSFAGFPQGMTSRLVASKDGFDPVSSNQRADTDLTGIVLVLEPIPLGYDVTGHIEDADTGQALANAAVRIDALGAVANTNATGDFILSLVPPGDHDLLAGATNYAPQTIPVTVVDQAVALPTIRLVQASLALVLRGKVTVQGLGVPVADAEVTLAPTTGGAAQVTRTNALGDYVFGGVAAGTYAFTIAAAGYGTHLDPALEVRTTLTHDVELSTAGGDGFTLSGLVQLSDESSGSWNGSRVSLEGPGTSKSDNTNGLGEFAFDRLDPGVYRVTASHNGYESASLEIAVASDTSQSFILQRNEEKQGVLASCFGCGQTEQAQGGWALIALFGLALPLLRRRW